MFRRALLLLCLLLIPSSLLMADSRHVHLRGSLMNSRLKFERAKAGHVAFMGGSITEMNGYRPMVCADLQKLFPETKFTFTDAGISSTCSTTGAFRLESDVLSKGKIDLFFIEFAVNDDQDAAHAGRECIRGLEGIIRHCLHHNPEMDIVVTYFVNEGMLASLQKGNMPLSMASHEKVAEHYSISSVHLAAEVADRMTAGTLTWQQYGGVHPAPHGNRIAADMIQQLLTRAWASPVEMLPSAHRIPVDPLDQYSYVRGRFVTPSEAVIVNGWEFAEPAWDSLPGSKRARFQKIPLLHSSEPGSEVTLKFSGQAVGAFVVAGPDAGIVEASVDGDEFSLHDLYHRFSAGLHYPRTVMFRTELPAGEHTLKLRIGREKNAASKGHAARIIQFAVN